MKERRASTELTSLFFYLWWHAIWEFPILCCCCCVGWIDSVKEEMRWSVAFLHINSYTNHMYIVSPRDVSPCIRKTSHVTGFMLRSIYTKYACKIRTLARKVRTRRDWARKGESVSHKRNNQWPWKERFAEIIWVRTHGLSLGIFFCSYFRGSIFHIRKFLSNPAYVWIKYKKRTKPLIGYSVNKIHNCIIISILSEEKKL